jgi:ferredoxin--NADP+ reductase
MQNDLIVEKDKMHELSEIRLLTSNTYVLKFEKNKLEFQPGQYITVGKTMVEPRQYSIYSGANKDYIEVLIKEVEGGKVSKQLRYSKPGDKLLVDGPFGHFTIKPNFLEKKKFLFVASGTGISPFHSFIESYPAIDYQILHGVRYAEEAYDKAHYEKERITVCTSQDDKGDYHGRVTDYLHENDIDLETEVYLCGNSEMILEVFDILEEKRLPTEQIHTEVYF